MGSTGLPSFEGRTVLDVGCGMGRNPYWMLKAGAKSVVAVDVDDQSLTAAKRNLSSFENAEVRKCSIYELDPAKLGQFDRVTCIGVLHHLAKPEEALVRLWSCVRPGGALVLWCYGRDGNALFLPVIQALRFVASRLPIKAAHVLAKGVTVVAWPAFKILPWRNSYYRTLKKLSFKNVESIIFDQIIPHISHYWTRGDLEALTTPLGGKAHIELVQGNSWHVRVER
jgi:cyclopropane fatty-acyl-phospholipid synthase-like methyltransferase